MPQYWMVSGKSYLQLWKENLKSGTGGKISKDRGISSTFSNEIMLYIYIYIYICYESLS